MELIVKLNLQCDVNRLWHECITIIAKHGWGTTGQICFTHREHVEGDDRFFDGAGSLSTGIKESDFSLLNSELIGTYVEEIIKTIPHKMGRIRLMRMRGRTCYSLHRDSTMRIHIPLITNTQALFLFPHRAIVRHLPADGSVFLTDTRIIHTAMNGSEADRYHIVGALVE